jgi:hypothetical protein
MTTAVLADDIEDSEGLVYTNGVVFRRSMARLRDCRYVTNTPAATHLLTSVQENYDPDKQSDLDQWVNFNTYLANLDPLSFWGGGESRYGWRTMAYAFKHPDSLATLYRDPENESYGERRRDANILAAAQ